ncbi:MAG: DegT/DnrJ/EryC1/StrS family aminotransferase [Chitinophagaceae bacterium]|nr:DegT/DnrJ/EryC1/StrS family aminotransferase [Chitinophagaceae bacterium]
MHPIQMVDTRNQYLNIKVEVDNAIQDVLDSTAFINGEPVKTFSGNLSNYLGIEHTIPCANGTDALQIAMMALDLQPGDEIITPSFTYIATAEVIALLRLKPVFVEVDKETFCISPEAVEDAITSKTKAIVPVHLFGQAAPMEKIMDIANRHNLYVIEDNAQAIGCNYIFSDGTVKKTGTIGTIGATSFYPSKNLGAYGDGGAIFTADEKLANKINMIANHGQSKRYYHDIVGCNSRLDTLQAAILNIKLQLLEKYNEARKKVAAYYDTAFAAIPQINIPVRARYSDHVFHQYTLVLSDTNRDELIKHLADHKIPSMIYYPVPAHRQKMFDHFQSGNTMFPNTDWLTERVLSLPVHTEMNENQVDFITSTIINYFKNKSYTK